MESFYWLSKIEPYIIIKKTHQICHKWSQSWYEILTMGSFCAWDQVTTKYVPGTIRTTKYAKNTFVVNRFGSSAGQMWMKSDRENLPSQLF